MIALADKRQGSLADYYGKKTGYPQRCAGAVRIALLGSFTLNGFKEVLERKCAEVGLKATVYVNEYNQYVREITDRGSRYYRFKPEVTFLLVDVQSLLGDLFVDPYRIPAAKRMAVARSVARKMRALIEKSVRSGTGVMVVNNYAVPVYSPVGVLETKERFGYFAMVREMNDLLAAAGKDRSVYVFDYDAFAASIGKKVVCNEKLRYLGDMKIAPDVIPPLCDEYMRYIKALKGLGKKCIVLDLDNTLWGGIVGEDGFAGIRLGPTAPGNAYVEFQKHLLALANRGVMLALNSNNNPDDALAVVRRHPSMVLREDRFAAIKINWEPKIRNLLAIARELNIGLDSLVFIDDDARNRQMVREALPQVLCPDVPDDASAYVEMITDLAARHFDALQLTDEDRRRGELYVRERQRKESMAVFSDLSGYLRHLRIVVEIRRADAFSIPRIAQLASRTNQFNFTTKRYSENRIASLARAKGTRVYAISVRDRYGDYGIAGAVIVRDASGGWVIDTFLLSCRVLGKNIEDAIIAAFVDKAVRARVGHIVLEYRKTAKNLPALDFLKANGVRGVSDAMRMMRIPIYRRPAQVPVSFSARGKHIKVTMV